MKFATLTILTSFLLSMSSYSQEDIFQTDSLHNQIADLDSTVSYLEENLEDASERINYLILKSNNSQNELVLLNERVDSLKSSNLKLVEKLAKSESELTHQIKQQEEAASSSFSKLGDRLDKNTLYWSIGLLLVLILILVISYLVRKAARKGDKALYDQLQLSKSMLDEEMVKIDNKLIELLEGQLKVQSENKQGVTSEVEIDYSLALKVANEIVKIEKNLTQMDPGVRGYKQLNKAVERMKDNITASGYEIVEMLNKPYNDGMKVQANFRPDDSLKPDEQIITRIIKPQVNFQGKMIQAAQIEVSQGV